MRFIYNRFKTRFEDYFVEDFLNALPADVTDPALQVAKDHARKLERLTVFMAYQVHRKMAADTKNTERYQGILVGIKLLNSMIVRIPDRNAFAAKATEKGALDKALEGVEAFKAALSPSVPTDQQST